jgi:hypothetical protein
MKTLLRLAMLAAVFTDVFCALRLVPLAGWLTNPGATLVRAESAAQVAVGLQLRTALYLRRPNG